MHAHHRYPASWAIWATHRKTCSHPHPAALTTPCGVALAAGTVRVRAVRARASLLRGLRRITGYVLWNPEFRPQGQDVLHNPKTTGIPKFR